MGGRGWPQSTNFTGMTPLKRPPKAKGRPPYQKVAPRLRGSPSRQRDGDPFIYLFFSGLNKIDLKNEKPEGIFHDQGDAKWIVIRGQLRGHSDTGDRAVNPWAAYRLPVKNTNMCI
jgi:hypothetical protein